jgi:hypothetical protein
MPDRRAAAAALLLIVGCGGGERQDAGAPSGEFAVDMTRASFPARQSLAQEVTLRLDVRNTGRRVVPNLAVVVEGLSTTAGGERLADPARPVWVLDGRPLGGRTAYVDTWAFGRLAPGASRSVRFRLTAVRAGRWRVRWRVAPALLGEARFAGRAAGAFRVVISA